MSDLLIGILASVIASIVFYILGLITNSIIKTMKFSSFRRIWKPFLSNKECTIILTSRSGELPRSTPKISFTEMLSYTALHEKLSFLGITLIAKNSHIPLDSIKEDNLILLGGSYANEISRHFLSKIKTTQPFIIKASDTNEYFVKTSTSEYYPELGDDGRLVKDYAVIMRCANPYNTDNSVLIIMGCHGYGTYGGVLMITYKAYAETIVHSIKDRDFVMLVEFELSGNSIIGQKVVEFYLYPGMSA